MIIRLENQIARILESDDPHQAFRQFDEKANQHTLTGLQVRRDLQLKDKQFMETTRKFKP